MPWPLLREVSDAQANSAIQGALAQPEIPRVERWFFFDVWERLGGSFYRVKNQTWSHSADNSKGKSEASRC